MQPRYTLHMCVKKCEAIMVDFIVAILAPQPSDHSDKTLAPAEIASNSSRVT